MAVVRNLMVRAGADFSKLQKEMQKAQRNMNEFKNRMNSTLKGIGAGLATLGVGFGISKAIKSAMDVEAALQQINRIMGSSAKEFNDWANNGAKAFGLARSEAIMYGAVFGNLLSSFTKDSAETMKYTEELLKASAVVASSTGRTMDDVLERIRSGLLGNTEAIEDLGINVNVAMIESTNAFRQFANGKSWQQLDFQMQQQIRLLAILEQSSIKYGMALNQNTATSMQMFVAQLKNVQLSLGQAFLPIVNIVLPVLTAFVSKIAQAMSVVAQFSQALFGKSAKQATTQAQAQAKATNQSAGAVTNLGKALKKTGKQASKAQGSIASFDEINSLADKANAGGSGGNEDGAGGIGGGAGIGDTMPVNFDTNAPSISAKVKEMADKVKAFFGGIGSFISEHKDIIISALGGIAAGIATYVLATKGAKAATLIWTAIVKAAIVVTNGLKAAMAFLISPVGLIVVAVAALVAAFIYFYRTNEKFKGFVDGILNNIKDAAIWLWKNALVPLGEFLAKGFVIAWEAVKKAAEWTWKNVLIPLGEFFVWLWKNAIIPLGKVMIDILVAAFKFVSEVAMILWKNVLVPLGNFFKAILGPTIEAISSIFTYLWKTVLTPLGKFIAGPFSGEWKGFSDTIKQLWNNVLKPFIDFLKGGFLLAFDFVTKTIGGLIKMLQGIFIGLMTFITGVFTGNWKKAWEGVQQIFKSVFGNLYSIVKKPLNLIIDAINQVIGALNSISIKVPDWVPEYGGKKFGINIPKIPKLARGGIVDGATNMGNYIAGEAGAEMIVPLENTSFVDKLASALGTAVMNAMQTSNSGTGDIVLKLNEIELGRASAKGINSAQRQAGRLLLNI